MFAIFIVGALISVIYNLTPHSFAIRLPLSRRLMASHWSWTLLTLIGGITAAMTLFQVGPNWIIGKDTGITAYIDVAGAIFLLIGLGCLFLPFLTDYGAQRDPRRLPIEILVGFFNGSCSVFS